MNIVAILQARMSSSRLPGKVLVPIVGKPMLALQIERLKRALTLNKIVVATSDGSDDDPIADLCLQLKVDCFRGSLDDVLDRYYNAAKTYQADIVVRLTADCPLSDASVIDDAVKLFEKGSYDFVSNTIVRTWPQGLDVEVLKFSILENIWRISELPSEREHVTLRITAHPNHYKMGSLINPHDDTSNHRWTVDEEADLKLVRIIYASLYPSNPKFKSEDVLKLFEKQPHLYEFNNSVDRLSGLKKSLERDREYMRGN